VRKGNDVLGIDVSHLVLVALGDTDDQVVLLQSAFAHIFAVFEGFGVRRTMSVRTVRRVATFLREPWWISILMRSFLGCSGLSLVQTRNPNVNIRV
jgi:hypothetical protein